FAPKPRLHAAHGVAEHEAQVTDAKPLGHEPVLGFNHVIVIVFRKFGSQAVRWLRRLSGSDRVRQNDEVFARIQRLAGAEQLARPGRGAEADNPARKAGRKEFAPGAAGAMQEQRRLSQWIAERSVMQAQFRHDFAGVKAKVPRAPAALLRRRIVRGRSHRRYERERKCSCDADANGTHWSPPGCDAPPSARARGRNRMSNGPVNAALRREPAIMCRLRATVFPSSPARTARRSAQECRTSR